MDPELVHPARIHTQRPSTGPVMVNVGYQVGQDASTAALKPSRTATAIFRATGAH